MSNKHDVTLVVLPIWDSILCMNHIHMVVLLYHLADHIHFEMWGLTFFHF